MTTIMASMINIIPTTWATVMITTITIITRVIALNNPGNDSDRRNNSSQTSSKSTSNHTILMI